MRPGPLTTHMNVHTLLAHMRTHGYSHSSTCFHATTPPSHTLTCVPVLIFTLTCSHMHTYNSHSHALSRVLFLICTDIQRPRPACSYCQMPPPAGQVTALTVTATMGLSTPHDTISPGRPVSRLQEQCLLCCLPTQRCRHWAPWSRALSCSLTGVPGGLGMGVREDKAQCWCRRMTS